MSQYEESLRSSLLTNELNLLPYTQRYMYHQRQLALLKDNISLVVEQIKELQQQLSSLKKERMYHEFELCSPLLGNQSFLHTCTHCRGAVNDNHECELCKRLCDMPCTLQNQFEQPTVANTQTYNITIKPRNEEEANVLNRIHSIYTKRLPTLTSYNEFRFIKERIRYLNQDISEKELEHEIVRSYSTFKLADSYKLLIQNYLEFVSKNQYSDDFFQQEASFRKVINQFISLHKNDELI